MIVLQKNEVHNYNWLIKTLSKSCKYPPKLQKKNREEMVYVTYEIDNNGYITTQEVNERYVEVTGTSEIEIMPDKIHYIIEIREYFKEEFDGKYKPEEYHTKVPLSQIEQGLRKKLTEVGITQDAIRTQEIDDYWRKQGQDFLVSKQFDITLTDFKQIDEIIKHIDTKGINTMRIGELENKEMLVYHQKGKIEALKAAQRKATYLVEALGKKAG